MWFDKKQEFKISGLNIFSRKINCGYNNFCNKENEV